MKIYKIADINDVYNKIWTIIENEFLDLELILYPQDVEKFKREVKGMIGSINNRLDFAIKNPKAYELEFKQWEDEQRGI